MEYANEFDYIIYKKTQTQMWENPNFYSPHPKHCTFFLEEKSTDNSWN